MIVIQFLLQPLNSGDDVSEDDAGAASDTENVVVCQFDKVSYNDMIITTLKITL